MMAKICIISFLIQLFIIKLNDDTTNVNAENSEREILSKIGQLNDQIQQQDQRLESIEAKLEQILQAIKLRAYNLNGVDKTEIKSQTQTNQPPVNPINSKTKDIILALGGRSQKYHLSSVELYDPAENSGGASWRLVSPMPFNRSNFGAAVLHNQVYVCGGEDESHTAKNSCAAYDPVSDLWNTSIASMNFVRADFAMAAIGNSSFAVGGSYETNDSFSVSISMERYDPVQNVWTLLKDSHAPDSINDPSAVVSADGKNLYIAGGYDKFHDSYFQSFYKFDPAENSWTRLADIKTGRGGAGLVAVPTSGEIFLIGGTNGIYQTLDSVEIYNIAKNTWTNETVCGCAGGNFKLNERRAWAGATILNGEVYAAGGYGNDILDSVEKLNLSTNDNNLNKWEILTSQMIEPRYFHKLVTVKIQL